MPKALELTDQRFGFLVAVRRRGSHHGSALWSCICVCGNRVEVQANSLRSGNTKSCGCKGAARDFTGQRFGRLVVTRRLRKKGASWWDAVCDCGKRKQVRGYNLGKSTRSCGCLNAEKIRQKGALSRNWRGGRHLHADGHVLVYDPSHKNAFSDGYVFEHVQVMAKMLGRPLLRGEVVHHRNGRKSDNRPKNLELCLKRVHPPGQRVRDLIKDALWLISRYPEIARQLKKAVGDYAEDDVEIFKK